MRLVCTIWELYLWQKEPLNEVLFVYRLFALFELISMNIHSWKTNMTAEEGEKRRKTQKARFQKGLTLVAVTFVRPPEGASEEAGSRSYPAVCFP